MIKTSLIYRALCKEFYSIENVFNTISPYLEVKKLQLPYASQGMFNRLLNIWYIFRNRSQIIHITGHDHYLLWYPFKNVILTIHDIEALKRKSGLKKWLFKKLWFDIPIKNARIVTTISEFSKSEILSIKKYKTPIQVIHNPLTIDANFKPKKDISEKVRILHLGTKDNKNLIRLIKALCSIKCELTIIGQLKMNQLSAIKKYSLDYRNLQGLSEKELVNEYDRCDIVAFVSTYEGFGLPILEAQAIGRPVITSKRASMPEIAGDGALLVNPYSVLSISNGVKKLIEDPSLRDRLIKNGQLNLTNYKPRNVALKYKQVYKSFEM